MCAKLRTLPPNPRAITRICLQRLDLYQLQRFRGARTILACLLQHSDPAAGAFVRKFLQFAIFLNRQTAVPIFGQLRLPIISSFASHAVLLSFEVAQEHSTLVVSNLDGAHWALTTQIQMGLAGRLRWLRFLLHNFQHRPLRNLPRPLH